MFKRHITFTDLPPQPRCLRSIAPILHTN